MRGGLGRNGTAAGETNRSLTKHKCYYELANLRITPVVHEVRAPLETLAFLGRSNLVEPDEVSGGPQATTPGSDERERHC